MKQTRLFAKIISLVLVTAVILSSAVLLFACNKHKITLDDIFIESTSDKEFSSAKLEFTLPVGWEIYTSSLTSSSSTQSVSLNSDVGYIKSLNAFVIVKTGKLSIIKCNDTRVYETGCMPGMLFSEKRGISALRVKGNLIVCKFDNGEVGAFDINGKTAISRKKIHNAGTTTNIDSIIKILDDNLVAVHPTYDKAGVSGYTSIYRPTYDSDDLTQRGELVCRVSNNDNSLSYVDGFDGKYVSVIGNKAGSYVYLIPTHAGDSVKNMTATSNGTLASSGQTDYDSEITYIGKGKFFMHSMWSVSSSNDEYDYTSGEKRWKMSRYIYTPDNDSRTAYTANADKLFMNMTNNYYSSAKTGIDTTMYLKDGYTYAAFGLFFEFDEKVAFYDQYILDSNMNVVMSLTNNFGLEITGQTKDKVGIYDLLMTKVDGYYYVPLQPSEVNIYDGAGNLVGHNDRTTVQRQELSNNVLIAGITNPDNKDEVLYGAFNVRGEEIIPFTYNSLSAFRGSYTVGERVDKDNNRITEIVGTDGKPVTEMSDGSIPLADKAMTSSGASGRMVYKIGCYMFKETREGAVYYGIKNFNPNVEKNVVMPATMGAQSVLYAPSTSPSDVFVFERITDGTNVSYAIYRLI